MFGEDESESPRAGSPWDSFLSDGDLSRCTSSGLIPKLIPEVEEGNIEYKLKLINPTAERFARLVTQLKWRLLEGGGQAIYELGVADSGQLVGLSRSALEQSLHTLDEMAGEIGASVVVVKEIEVPHALLDLAARADGAMRMPKKRLEDAYANAENVTEGDADSTATDGDVEPELGTPVEEVDTELAFMYSISTFLTPTTYLRSHPDRPTAQSSPSILPLDADPTPDADTELDATEGFAIDLEISSVYKPRPTRRRVPISTASTHMHVRQSKVTTTTKSVTKDAPWRSKEPKAADEQTGKHGKSHGHGHGHGHKQWKRKKRKGQEKVGEKQAEHVKEQVPAGMDTDEEAKTTTTALADELASLVPQLHSLHVAVDDTADPVATVMDLFAPSSVSPSDEGAVELSAGPGIGEDGKRIGNDDADAHRNNRDSRRVMVEVLVVRKMSIEEAFLDFGGFSLDR